MVIVWTPGPIIISCVWRIQESSQPSLDGRWNFDQSDILPSLLGPKVQPCNLHSANWGEFPAQFSNKSPYILKQVCLVDLSAWLALGFVLVAFINSRGSCEINPTRQYSLPGHLNELGI